VSQRQGDVLGKCLVLDAQGLSKKGSLVQAHPDKASVPLQGQLSSKTPFPSTQILQACALHANKLSCAVE